MCLNVQQILPALKMPEARDAADFYEISRGPNTKWRSTPHQPETCLRRRSFAQQSDQRIPCRSWSYDVTNRSVHTGGVKKMLDPCPAVG